MFTDFSPSQVRRVRSCPKLLPPSEDVAAQISDTPQSSHPSPLNRLYTNSTCPFFRLKKAPSLLRGFFFSFDGINSATTFPSSLYSISALFTSFPTLSFFQLFSKSPDGLSAFHSAHHDPLDKIFLQKRVHCHNGQHHQDGGGRFDGVRVGVHQGPDGLHS